MELVGLRFEKQEHVGVLTLDRPEKLNIIDHALIESMTRGISRLEYDLDIRCLVIAGSGRAFCAGADLGTEAAATSYEIEMFAHLGTILMHKVKNFRTPVLAAINGHALGGGMELALACDYRFASEKASFGSPEINFSTVAGWGGASTLASFIGMSQAKRLLFTGIHIKAPEALRLGIVDEVMPPEEVLPAAMLMATKIASMAPLAMELVKRAVHAGESFDPKEIGTLYVTEDAKEAYASFFEKRPNRGYHRK